MGVGAWPEAGDDPLLTLAHLLAGIDSLLFPFTEWWWRSPRTSPPVSAQVCGKDTADAGRVVTCGERKDTVLETQISARANAVQGA